MIRGAARPRELFFLVHLLLNLVVRFLHPAFQLVEFRGCKKVLLNSIREVDVWVPTENQGNIRLTDALFETLLQVCDASVGRIVVLGMDLIGYLRVDQPDMQAPAPVDDPAEQVGILEFLKYRAC